MAEIDLTQKGSATFKIPLLVFLGQINKPLSFIFFLMLASFLFLRLMSVLMSVNRTAVRETALVI